MAQIIPAILEETIEGFQQKEFAVTRVLGVERIQVDFADGKFVPHTTVSISELDVLNPAFHWEAHLMVQTPDDFLDYEIAGFKTIIVHYEAFEDDDERISAIQAIKDLNLVPGLAINPETPIAALEPFAEMVQHFTIMGVHPGMQNQPFLAETPERVAALRKLIPNAILEVDGGVTGETAPALVTAGADLLAIGHALFETENVQENYDALLTASKK